MGNIVAFNSARKRVNHEKTIQEWDVNDFQDLYESAEKNMGKNNAWKLVYELIKVRAGEVPILDTDNIDWNEL